jgi:hypothetical protein
MACAARLDFDRFLHQRTGPRDRSVPEGSAGRPTPASMAGAGETPCQPALGRRIRRLSSPSVRMVGSRHCLDWRALSVPELLQVASDRRAGSATVAPLNAFRVLSMRFLPSSPKRKGAGGPLVHARLRYPEQHGQLVHGQPPRSGRADRLSRRVRLLWETEGRPFELGRPDHLEGRKGGFWPVSVLAYVGQEEHICYRLLPGTG